MCSFDLWTVPMGIFFSQQKTLKSLDLLFLPQLFDFSPSLLPMGFFQQFLTAAVDFPAVNAPSPTHHARPGASIPPTFFLCRCYARRPSGHLRSR